MPKRVIDFDAMWASDKIAACAEWAQAEYAWLYGLADCAGCFECTSLRVIWGRVSAIRRNFSLERLEQVFDEFRDKGLLFVWEENGKRYGHWTGSDVPGRLPPPSWRNRLERLAPPVPREAFAKYVAAHSAGIKNKLRCEPLPDGTSAACGRELQQPIDFGAGIPRTEPAGVWRDERSANCAGGSRLKACLEVPQAQDLDLELDSGGKRGEEKHTLSAADERSVSESLKFPLEIRAKAEGSGFGKVEMISERSPRPDGTTWTTTSKEIQKRFEQNANSKAQNKNTAPEMLREMWERHRGPLPEVLVFSSERAARCQDRISHAIRKNGNAAQFLADFRKAVERAACTPFLCGGGPAGWRANFDWLIANNTNYLKVLEGRYDAGAGISVGAINSAARENTKTREATSSGAIARDTSITRAEVVQKELSAGAGPSPAQTETHVRAGVIARIFGRS